MPASIEQLVESVSRELLARGLKISTAESCTGGLLAAALTSRPGASAIFECGLVTYSNESKIELLDVPPEILKEYGAVSDACATAMAEGVLVKYDAHLAVAITGIAGPDGGSKDKPVGLVFIAYADIRARKHSNYYHFTGDREAIRAQTVIQALTGLISFLNAD